MPTTISDSSCPISIFVASLKKYDDGAPENSPPMIIRFYVKLLTAKSFGSSPSYDSSLGDFDVLAWEMFRQIKYGHADRCCIVLLLSWPPFTVGWWKKIDISSSVIVLVHRMRMRLVILCLEN